MIHSTKTAITTKNNNIISTKITIATTAATQ